MTPAHHATAKPLLPGLFCGAGGAAMGYHRAGFEVVGVDIKCQPRYPFRFIQANALTFPLYGFGAIHASPPCQRFTVANVIHGREHPGLLTPTRLRLQQQSAPWVIENVPKPPMRGDVVLCGSMFGEPRLKRHRLFEFWEPPPALCLLPPCNHAKELVTLFGHGGHVYHGMDDWRRVMGIGWMTRGELSQAIPPTYTEYIGRQLMAVLS